MASKSTPGKSFQMPHPVNTLSIVLEAGERLGYEGAALRAYVDEERERQEKVIQQEMDREERASQRDLERLRLEYQKEQEIRKAAQELQVATQSNVNNKPPKGPNLPPFDDKSDSIDSFIERFEIYAQGQKWDKANWGTYLGALLKGRALDTYTHLPVGTSRDFDSLKAALLRSFNLTAETYRKRFYSTRQTSNEGVREYLQRLENSFMKWVDSSDTKHTFPNLRDLLIMEQYIFSCPRDMAIYLREHRPTKMDEITLLAETYLDAHRGALRDRTKFENSRPQVNGKSGDRPNTTERDRDGSTKPRGPQCWRCLAYGHKSSECRASEPAGPQSNQTGEKRIGKPQGTYNRSPNDKINATLIEPSDESSWLVASIAEAKKNTDGKLFVERGYIGQEKFPVMVLRDNACTGIVVRTSLVKPNEFTGRSRRYWLADNSSGEAPEAIIQIISPFYTGKIRAICLPNPVRDVLIGNVEGVRDYPMQTQDVLDDVDTETTAAVVTRAQVERENKPLKPLKVPTPIDVEVESADFAQMQSNDDTLAVYFDKAKNPDENRNPRVSFKMSNGLLYRVYKSRENEIIEQLVVPATLRKKVVKLSHDIVLSGHLGVRKTIARIISHFFWPRLDSYVRKYCRECDACQKTIPKGRIPKAPLQQIPVISEPFSRVGIDLIGPMAPMSERKNRYALVLIDYATRYPEAVALPSIETERVAEALMSIFTRVGFPREIVTDRGSNLMSKVMAEVFRLLSIKHLPTTSFHPMGNGAVERFNAVLKQMIKRLCQEKPRDWDRYIEPALFAYREVPNDSTGYAPFELVYGRQVRGPLALLKAAWSGGDTPDQVQSVYEYVTDLRGRLEGGAEAARLALTESSKRYKKYFDRKAKPRQLQVGDKALVILPTDHNKLLLQWKGPFPVVAKHGEVDYTLEMGAGQPRKFHINMLKQYFTREDDVDISAVTFIADDEGVGLGNEHLLRFDLPSAKSSVETYEEVHVDPDLPEEKRQELQALVYEFREIFSSIPGTTNLLEHEIVLTSDKPVRAKQYPLPYAMREDINKEVRHMLSLGVIVPSQSEYSSPLLLVAKSDGTKRPVVDFRKLNELTIFDSEPMPQPEEIFGKLHSDRYFSRTDFCKGFWAIPLKLENRKYTSFPCSLGLFEFTKMPFGLVNSGATYNRLVRKLLNGAPHHDSYVDDTLTHTLDWSNHVSALKDLFTRIKNAGLTLRPSKCFFGYSSVEFLGRVVGDGWISPVLEKVKPILEAPPPRTKTQVRSFLGAISFYRSYVPNFSSLSAPLSDLTGKNKSNKVVWTQDCQDAFVKLKEALANEPVLRLPAYTMPFVVRTDSSDYGIGGVLMQEHEGKLHPVTCVSRKLSVREKQLSCIEKECLALVWTIEKLAPYLLGTEFVLQSDHAPLQFLQTCVHTNPKIIRWALTLQSYKFKVEHVKGRDNTFADFLSRLPSD